jgi:hypothetical protein
MSDREIHPPFVADENLQTAYEEKEDHEDFVNEMPVNRKTAAQQKNLSTSRLSPAFERRTMILVDTKESKISGQHHKRGRMHI